LAALGAKGVVPTPEGEAKMSAAILEVAKPLTKQYAETQEQLTTLIALVIAGWNKSLFPLDKQSIVEKEIIDRFVPEDGSGESIGVAMDIMDTAAQRRKERFPDLRRIVVDYEVEISGDNFNLNVSSAPVPEV